MAKRVSSIRRETRETSIRVDLCIEGTGNFDINTGIPMFDHLLSQMARHGLFDLRITAKGDDQHHVVRAAAHQINGHHARSVRLVGASVEGQDDL